MQYNVREILSWDQSLSLFTYSQSNAISIWEIEWDNLLIMQPNMQVSQDITFINNLSVSEQMFLIRNSQEAHHLGPQVRVPGTATLNFLGFLRGQILPARELKLTLALPPQCPCLHCCLWDAEPFLHNTQDCTIPNLLRLTKYCPLVCIIPPQYLPFRFI